MAKQTVQWKKRILLPIWAIRICAMLFVCVVFGLAIGWIKQEKGSFPALGAVVFFFLLIIAVLLMDILQILKLLNHSLTPIALLIINTIQAAFWGGIVLMDIVYIARDRSSATGLVLSLGLFILFLATLVYAIVMFTRQRKEAKRGHYAPAHNPAMSDTTPTAYIGSPIQHHSTAYHSPMQDGGDLGQQHIPYPAYGAATNYYAEQPAKPANMV